MWTVLPQKAMPPFLDEAGASSAQEAKTGHTASTGSLECPSCRRLREGSSWTERTWEPYEIASHYWFRPSDGPATSRSLTAGLLLYIGRLSKSGIRQAPNLSAPACSPGRRGQPRRGWTPPTWTGCCSRELLPWTASPPASPRSRDCSALYHQLQDLSLTLSVRSEPGFGPSLAVCTRACSASGARVDRPM